MSSCLRISPDGSGLLSHVADGRGDHCKLVPRARLDDTGLVLSIVHWKWQAFGNTFPGSY